MKIKLSNCLTWLLWIFIIVSVHVIAKMPAANSVIRLFRLTTIPFLAFVVITVLLPQQPLNKVKRVFFLCFPPIVLLFINLFQIIALPTDVRSTHITGSVKFTAWFLLYIAIILDLNSTNVHKIKNRVFMILTIIFGVGILQYPQVIIQSGAGIGAALSGYGQLDERFQLYGIFGSSNEDANGFVTLFPLALLWIETQKGLRRKVLRLMLLMYFPLILIFNGTRTALLISFPLITTLFYWRLSLKKLLGLAGPLAAVCIGIFSLSEKLVAHNFSEESQGGGSFGWRVEHVWTPAINYTLSHSPVFGFGSRGWEFMCQAKGLFNPETGEAISPHSGYVWALTSWGVLGLVAYVMFLLVLLLESFKLSRSTIEEVSIFGRALLCSCIGYCFWAFISNVIWDQGWMILISLAILIACLKILEVREEEAIKNEYIENE
jgi:hypothetical protein